MVKLWLNQPMKIFGVCLVFLFAHLMIGGNFFNLVRLRKDEKVLKQQLVEVSGQIQQIKHKIQQAKDPIFLENLAKDRLDMASEDDLVFVFSSE